MEEGFVFIHPAFCGMIGSGSDQSLTTLLLTCSSTWPVNYRFMSCLCLVAGGPSGLDTIKPNLNFSSAWEKNNLIIVVDIQEACSVQPDHYLVKIVPDKYSLISVVVSRECYREREHAIYFMCIPYQWFSKGMVRKGGGKWIRFCKYLDKIGQISVWFWEGISQNFHKKEYMYILKFGLLLFRWWRE